jgi:aryl-alcohol dehydrogenase-like predicted oxidoreductase
LGLGCAYIGRDLPEKTSRAVVEAALEGGIRYFDTAPNYLHSEERLGPVLGPVRDRVFLATKVEHADAKGAEEDLAQSLKLLKTDHVDLVLLHGLDLPDWSNAKAILSKDGALAGLRQAKAKGLTRFIGFSTHPKHKVAQQVLAAAPDLDVVMPFINYVSRAENNAEEHIVAQARQQNLGVTAMKVLGGNGQLAKDYDRAFRYALSVPGVHCALIGARKVDEVQRAVQAAKQFRPLTEAEMAEAISLGRWLSATDSQQARLLRTHLAMDYGVARVTEPGSGNHRAGLKV